MAFRVEGRTEAGAKGENHLDALALNCGEALHGCVVGYADGFLPAFLELSLEVELDPFGMEIDGGVDDAALDDSGKADGDTIELRDLRFELFDSGEHARGCRVLRCRGAEAVGEGLAGRVKKHDLDAGAADVDAKGSGRFYGSLQWHTRVNI